jgi:hypothetical protein
MASKIGGVKCLFGRNLVEFDYISVHRDGFVPINVKTMKMIQLENIES